MNTPAVNLDAGQFEVDNSQSPATLQSGEFEVAGGTPGQAPVNPYAREAAQDAANADMSNLSKGPFDQAIYSTSQTDTPARFNPGQAPLSAGEQEFNRVNPQSQFARRPQAAPTTFAEANQQTLNPGEFEIAPAAPVSLQQPGVSSDLPDETQVRNQNLAKYAQLAKTDPKAADTFAEQKGMTVSDKQEAVGANRGFDPIAGVGEAAKGAYDLGGALKGENGPRANASAQAGNEILSGLMNAYSGQFGEAAVRAPIMTMAGYLAGIASGKVASEAAKAVGATPEEQEFANTLFFFVPTAAVTLSGLQVSKAVAGESVGYKASAFGGRVEVGAKSTPEETGFAAKVGPFSASVVKPRGADVEFNGNGPTNLPGGAPPPPLNPVAMLSQDQGQSVVQAAGRYEETERVAHDIANGGTPPTPPKPPDPSGMDQGHLQMSTVERLGQIIQALPAPMQPRAMLESVKSLSKWLFDKKTVVGPDDKVVTVETPQQAQNAAVKMVNGEIDRQKQQAQEKTEALQKETEQRESDAAEAQQEREESLAGKGLGSSTNAKTPESQKVEIPDTPGVQKARAVLASLPLETTSEKADKELGKTVLLPTPIRKALIEEFVSSRAKAIEGAAQESMTGKPTPQGQKPEEIDAWVAGVQKGETPFAHVQKGTTYQPTDVEGLAKTKVDGAKDASGIYYHDPEISGAEIRKAARAGTLDQLTEKWKAGKKPTTVEQGSTASNEVEKQEAAKEEPKNSYGSTQANLPQDSRAHRAIVEAQQQIDSKDLAGKGPDVDEPHVTLRYGIQGDDTSQIENFPQQQAPFEARLGKTEAFPPTENSDGAAVIHAPVESEDLQRMNSEIEQHGEFKKSDFPDYKPHVTVAYVKPEAVEKYTDMEGTQWQRCNGDRISISDREGNKREVLLKGEPRPAESTGKEISEILANNGINTTSVEADHLLEQNLLLMAPALRAQLGNSLLGTILDSPELAARTPAFIKDRLLGSTGTISSIVSKDDQWNLKTPLKAAIEQD